MNPGRIPASKIIKKGLSTGIFCMLLAMAGPLMAQPPGSATPRPADAAAFQSAAAPRQSPASVIFDTDMGPDYDDVGAIALLHAMADKGECKILATIASNKYPRVAAVLSVMNTYFNRPGIPIGVVRGNAVDIGCRQKWDLLVVGKYPHALNTNDQAADALSLYRKVLASQPDRSVRIITVGFLTNMIAFDGWPVPILFSGFEIGSTIFTGLPLINDSSIGDGCARI